MKNYSSNRAQKGKTAYRTPSLYRANKSMHVADVKARVRNSGIVKIQQLSFLRKQESRLNSHKIPAFAGMTDKQQAMNEKIKIISVGGSIIVPKTGFDVDFLKQFRQLILEEVEKGYKFILVIGGGATCRAYQAAASRVKEMTPEDLDWLGIYTTYYNAEFVRLLFGDYASKKVCKNPTKKIITEKPIVLAGGWMPGFSTDRDAVLLAKNFKVQEVINLSNFDYVYSADPKKDSTAKPYKKLSWPEMRKIVGDKWNPGANLPFDPLAVTTAQKLGLKVVFVRGTNLREAQKAIEGGEVDGTVVG